MPFHYNIANDKWVNDLGFISVYVDKNVKI